jgi:uncharacterized protein YkwD
MRAIILLAVVLLAGSVTAGPGGRPAPPPLPEPARPMVDALQRHATHWRAHYGLPVQRVDDACCRKAQRWADYMARHGYFDHGPDDQIIAVGYTTPSACVRSWVWSAPHRAWLLSWNTRVGWGAAQDSAGRWWWCGVYAR